jgi:MYXO-CTERM domain-containing protein
MPVKSHLCLATIAVLILLGGNVYADLTSLILQPTPDIFSGYIDVTYNASSNTFAANGWALAFYDGVEQINFDEYTEGSFSISATVDESGVASSGSLTLTGQVLGYGSTGPLLTANNLSYFNSFFTDTLNPNMDVAMFEFLFDVSGGEMADMFGGSGAKVGVIIGYTAVGPDVTQNQFTADFDNLFGNGPGYGSSVSDTGTPTPEPATLSLLAVGAAALLRRRRS